MSHASGQAPRQLLLDLSVLVHKDDQSGIQRVVRSLLQAWRAATPQGWQIATVYDAGGYYAYAEYADADANAGDGCDGDDHGHRDGAQPRAQAQVRPATEPRAIQVRTGDLFLGLDLCPDLVPGNRAIYEDLRRHGVRIAFLVYDLLPVRQPEMFAPGASPWFARWLETVSGVSDQLICISRAVADELLEWIEQADVPNPGRLDISWFHLGADLQADPAALLPANAAVSAAEEATLAALAGRPSFLMVGTLEPRKMHAQALDAFERLWREGSEACLVIVGKAGWMTEQLARRLERHSQLGQRLFWLHHASDAALARLYAECSALLAASCGEGFGLPLIEAARQGLPIVARALPVFREVCGDHAHYFEGGSIELAAALQAWLRLQAEGQAPASAGLPHLDWAASARQLEQALAGKRPYRWAATLLP